MRQTTYWIVWFLSQTLYYSIILPFRILWFISINCNLAGLHESLQKIHNRYLNPLIRLRPGEFTHKLLDGRLLQYHVRGGEGFIKTFFPHGQLDTEICVTKGTMQGPSRSYYENGAIKCDADYKNSLQIHERHYYETCELQIVVDRKEYNYEETTTGYFTNGKIMTELIRKGRHTLRRDYDDVCRLKFSYESNNGTIIEETQFDENGHAVYVPHSTSKCNTLTEGFRCSFESQTLSG